jgi:hypothetical protein
MAWQYTITPSGRERFLEWLRPPFRPEVTSPPPDPLRTRVHFLGLLPPPQRAALLRDAIERLGGHLEALEPTPDDNDDDRRALRGAVLVLRARIEWLTKLHAEATRSARRR